MSGSILPPETAQGVKDFRTLIEESTVIIDKSMLVKAFLRNKDETALITYPRRWGKTINLSMIKTFFELEVDKNGVPLPDEQKNNIEIFSKGKWENGKKVPLAIWHEKEIVAQHFGKYPVIHISFKDVRGSNYKEIEELVHDQIITLFNHYNYLEKFIAKTPDINKTKKRSLLNYFNGTIRLPQLKNALKDLSYMLTIFHKQKVIILIDEYDTAINDTSLTFKNISQTNKILKLFRGILGGALKENTYLKKGLVTGIYRIAKADLFSGVNNFGEYNILDINYTPYYGFTQQEVEYLLKQHNIPSNLVKKIKGWYNGYNTNDLEIYNPWSIIKCLNQYNVYKAAGARDIETKILQSYWEHSGNVDFILKLLKNELVKKYVEKLIDYQSISFDLQRHITMGDYIELRNLTNAGSNYHVTAEGLDLLFSYLFFGGYLTVHKLPALFRFPNKEIEKELAKKLLKYYKTEYTVDHGLFQNVTDKIQIILDSRLETKYLDEFIENFRLALENLLQALPKFGVFDVKSSNESNLPSNNIEEKIASKDLQPSSFSSSNEVVYHGNEDLVHSLLNYIVLQVNTITRFATEISVGYGKADVAFIDEKNGCATIIELKYNQTADIALQQINDRAYARDIISSYNTILLGVNILPDKRVELKHRVVLKEVNG